MLQEVPRTPAMAQATRPPGGYLVVFLSFVACSRSFLSGPGLPYRDRIAAISVTMLSAAACESNSPVSALWTFSWMMSDAIG